ncbi:MULTISPECIES: transporter substrate-binding domain-containing protein [unclassified Variovorax]|uniref:transporter substrate-binding domain-containing protein n=1 Tax=unclassified Variovorax TaxID=663243 RepID=UPI0013168C41|nr:MULTISPECIES: transporter substrate-binding domain-containing protein [unclassified Variovorax]VTU34278.1 ABC transporter glutamine-binding protein GlnH precursor [Variovorax sp. SRS16]VTU40214.1 ABC transporter glutamine-binding protein GlnH precursor [Variovorax sp. PBL-E5]
MNAKTSFQRQRRALTLALGASLSLASLGAAAQTATLQKVKQSGELRIGVAPGDPWYYRDPSSGQWTGLGVLLGEQVAKDMGVKMTPVETTWGNCVAALQAGQIDAMFVLDATDERKKAVDFPSNPLLWYAQGVLAKDGLVARNWSDLDKPEVRIGVALGTATDRDLTKRLPNAKIERFTNTDETVAAFMTGRVDAIGFYHPALVIAYSKIRKGRVQVPQPVVALPTSVGIRREADPGFRNQLDTIIGKLYASGQTQALYGQYLKTKGIDPATVPGVMKETLGQ